MIINFSIKNYKSFREETLLSMEAEDFRAYKEAIVRALSDRSVLLVAGIFGPNAGGKSNILKGLDFFLQAVRGYDNAKNQLFSIVHHPLLSRFRLDGNDDPTEFEIEILSRDGHREYYYGFSIDGNTVLHEKLELLERANKNRVSKTIFERHKGDIIYHESIKDDINKLSKVIAYGDDVLTATRLANIVKLPIVVDFMKELSHIKVSSNNGGIDVNSLYSSPDLLKKAVSFVREADTSIVDISVDKAKIPDEIKQKLSGSSDIPETFRKAITDDNIYSIRSIHRGYGKNSSSSVLFNFGSDESRGTNRFFSLAVPIIEALETGGVLALDEIESSLHPFLSAKIVETFQDPNINKKHAQLIFTSHETYLLSKDVGLRTDQIYLVEKNQQEQSIMTAISEYKTRNNAAIDRQYLDSRFGGVPILASGGFDYEG